MESEATRRNEDVDLSTGEAENTVEKEASVIEGEGIGENERRMNSTITGDGDLVRLSPEQKMRMEVSGLLVDAIKSLVEARQDPEPGEVVDTISGVPVNIRNALYAYRPTSPLEAILYDDRKTKVEEACDAMGTHADALIRWVQETRSSTLIPLQNFYRIQDEKANKAATSECDPPQISSDEEAVAYIEGRLESLKNKLGATEARWERCIHTRSRLDQGWRTFRVRMDIECEVRKVIRRRSGGTGVFRQTAFDILRSLQTSDAKQTAKLEWMQRWADGARKHPAYALLDAPDDLDPVSTLSFTEVVGSRVIQTWASEVGLRVAEEMVLTCENFTKVILSVVVDDIEEKVRGIMRTLDVLGPASRSAVDTFTARSRHGRDT